MRRLTTWMGVALSTCLFVGIMVSMAIADTVYLEFPTDTFYKATNTYYDNWYALDFDASSWPYAIRHEHYFADPWIKAATVGNNTYFRHELKFTYMDLVPAGGTIDKVYVKIMANSEFDFWFNGSPRGGENTSKAGPLVLFDVTSQFNPTGKNIIAINARCPASNSAQVYAVLRIDMSMLPIISVAEHPPAITQRRGEVSSYPNPFNPGTSLRYGVPTEGFAILRILDSSGRVVRTLVSEYRAEGTYEATWDGKNDAGREVESGTYFCELATAAGKATGKVVLIK